jgi:hypothetical protein
MKLPMHPAPGLGDLMPGWFVVPQNPILDRGTPLVPSVQATNPNGISRIPRLGDLVVGSFTVPQNPLTNPSPMQAGMGCSSCGGANFYGMNGLGQSFSEVFTDIGAGNWSQAGTDLTSWLEASTMISGIPNWGIVGAGAAALLLFLPSGPEYRASRSQHRTYKRIARRVSNPRRRNIAAGFYDEDGYFHPIRASYDYSAKRAGETPKRRKR